MRFSEAELLLWVASFVWPFLRIGALFVSIPVFSGRSLPARIRILLAFAVTLVAMPLLPAPPTVPIFSYQGGMIAVQQVAIGILMGFIMQLVFAAVAFGGQGIAYSMGLGFASMVDPQTGVQVPVVAQFYLILATLVFLGMDGHLVLIQLLIDSFETLPIGIDGLGHASLWAMLAWSGRMFAGGLLLALPVICSLLLVNIAFGVATRAAPQINIFSVGFAATIVLGLWLIWVTLPNVLSQFSGLLSDGYRLVAAVLRV